MLWRQKKKKVLSLSFLCSRMGLLIIIISAVLVKVDRDKWPNLIFKKSRVTVQGEGKIFVLLKNKSSDIILTWKCLLGEARSLITAYFIVTKLGRTIKGESQKTCYSSVRIGGHRNWQKTIRFCLLWQVAQLINSLLKYLQSDYLSTNLLKSMVSQFQFHS